MKIDLINKTITKDEVQYLLPDGVPVPFEMEVLNSDSIKLIHLWTYLNEYRFIYEISPRHVNMRYASYEELSDEDIDDGLEPEKFIDSYRIGIPWTYFVFSANNSAIYVRPTKIKDITKDNFGIFYPNTSTGGICWGGIKIAKKKDESLTRYHQRLITSFFDSDYNSEMTDFDTLLYRHDLSLSDICNLPLNDICKKIQVLDKVNINAYFNTDIMIQNAHRNLVKVKNTVKNTKKITTPVD